MKTPLLLFVLFLLASCASSYGPIHSKMNEREGIASTQGRVGDRLSVHGLECIEDDPLGDIRNSCSFQKKGEAVILEVLKGDKVKFQVLDNLHFQEGDRVSSSSLPGPAFYP